MEGLPPLYVLWAGPPLDDLTALERQLAEKGIPGARCQSLPQCSAAQVTAPGEAAYDRLRGLKELFVGGSPAVVTTRHPAPLPVSPQRVATGPVVPASTRPANIFKLCLTGGPCAGKTTVLSTIVGRFNAQGVRTYAVPEAATILIMGGLSFTDMNPTKSFRYQLALLQTQLDLEQRFLDIATADVGPALIVCDRGAMDGRAYCDEDTWADILASLGVDNVQLRDQQYDAVFHMVTAAKGAEPFYGAATNEARRETPEEARQLDDRTLNCYLGHPRLRIFDNSTDFATKVERVLTSVAEQMGVRVRTHGSYRRYLVRSPPPVNLPVPTVRIQVEICILQTSDPDCELRLLARGQDDRWSYFLQELRTIDEQPLLTEKRLTWSEYQDRRKQVDPDTEVIEKSSLSFTYRHQYFEMGTFIHPTQYRGIALLYIDVNATSGEPQLPPFIPVTREVTNDPNFSSSAIAQVEYDVLESRVAEDAGSFDRFQSAPAWSARHAAPFSLRSTKLGAGPAPPSPAAGACPRFSAANFRSASASPTRLLKGLEVLPRVGTSVRRPPGPPAD